MFKKISVALLVAALLIASAVPMTVGAAALIEKDVDVVANIMVKSTGSSYVNAPAGNPLVASTGTTFAYMATLDMSSVRDAYTSYLAKALTEVQKIDPAATESDFTVSEMEISLTAIVADGLSVNSNFQSASDMAGFSAWDGKGNPASDISIYTESDARTKDGKEVSITVGLANVMTADQLAGKLGDLKFEFSGIKATKTGSLKVTGVLTGYTDIAYKGNDFAKINYTGVQDTTTGDDDLSATVLIKSAPGSSGSSGGRSGGSNAGTSQTAPQITTNVNGRIINGGYGKPVDGQYVVYVGDLPVPDEVPGYSWDGRWYRNPTCTEPVEGTVPVDENTVFYTRYVNTTAPSVLKSDSHVAYIKGYPDGYVKPEKNITREEIAMILYRLIKDDVKANIYSADNDFSDVDASRWSNEAISTMTKGGYLKGFTDGTFKPQGSITRAQFAAILVRFLDADAIAAGDYAFNDINGHWAEADIRKAADYMWILGYADGSFKPDQSITRAEAMTIFNRVLVRYVDASGISPAAKQFPDNTADSWYYYQVLEAVNDHEYTRQANGYNETWTSVGE